MKKIATLALLVLAKAAAADTDAGTIDTPTVESCTIGNFANGWHLGGSVGALGFSGSQTLRGNSTTAYNFTSWNPIVTIDGKYAMSCGNLYRVIDARAGWIFMNKKVNASAGYATLKQGFTLGAGFRLGTFINDSTAVFGRLGLNANAQRLDYVYGGVRKKDRFMQYSFEPGVGFEWAVGAGKTVELLYGYDFGFTTKGSNSSQHTYSKGPNAQHITVGFAVKL